MAKLIAHYYNSRKGEYKSFEIDGLKETAKQYSRPSAAAMSSPGQYWSVMAKAEIDKLRPEYGGYYMYSLQDNMERFKELVIANLEQKANAVKLEHDKALGHLMQARMQA